jgi:hypothetical protein
LRFGIAVAGRNDHEAETDQPDQTPERVSKTFIWGLIITILFILDHNSFRNVVIPVNSQFSPIPFGHLSFLTITTLSYYDISPASGLARSLAMIEAVIGQLYLVLQATLSVGFRVL